MWANGMVMNLCWGKGSRVRTGQACQSDDNLKLQTHIPGEFPLRDPIRSRDASVIRNSNNLEP